MAHREIHSLTAEKPLAPLPLEPRIQSRSPLTLISVRTIRAGGAVLAGMSYLLLTSTEKTPQLPQVFVDDVSILYALLCIAIGLAFTERRTPTMFAIGLIALILSMARVTAGPDTLLAITLFFTYVLFSLTIRTDALRRSLMIAACFLLAYLPSPSQLFGQPRTGTTPAVETASFVIAVFICIMAEAVLFSGNKYLLERARSERLSSALDSLARVNVGFQQHSRDVEERSKREERKRVTRDIHDIMGYALTNLSIMLDAALGLLPEDPARVQSILLRGREHIDTAHSEARRALHALHSLEKAQTHGTRNILRIGNQFEEASSLQVEVDLGNTRATYGPSTDSTLYSFVQEGLTNALRHGSATHVEVRLWQTDSAIVVTIRDNGIGAENVEEGIGFLGMRERLSQLSGSLYWESVPTVGFLLRCQVPLEKTAARGAPHSAE